MKGPIQKGEGGAALDGARRVYFPDCVEAELEAAIEALERLVAAFPPDWKPGMRASAAHGAAATAAINALGADLTPDAIKNVALTVFGQLLEGLPDELIEEAAATAYFRFTNEGRLRLAAALKTKGSA